MNKIIYQQGLLEVFLLILDPYYLITLYRALMLYFSFRADTTLLKHNHSQIGDKKSTKPSFQLTQAAITLCFLFLAKNREFVFREHVIIFLQHLLVTYYPNQLTFCESYALSQLVIGYFVLNQTLMFPYLSEIVLILAVLSVLVIFALAKVPSKDMAFALTFIAILKLNFFTILKYLEYRQDSLAKLVSAILTRDFGTYFLIQLMFLLLIVPIKVYKGKRIIHRKLFHFQIFMIVNFGLQYNTGYTRLALAVFLWLFLVLEALRQKYRGQITALQSYSDFMLSFCDNRDSEDFIKTHIYLLMGISLSVFLSNEMPYLGIVVLGIGDSIAAIVGSSVGRLTLPRSSRTVEGSLGFLASTCLVEYLMTGKVHMVIWIVGMALEAYTGQIDNLVLPKILMNLVQCFQGL